MEWRRIWHKKTIGITLLLIFLTLFFYAKEQFHTVYSYSVFEQNAIRNECNREYQGQDLTKAAEELEKRSEFSSNMSQYIEYRQMKREMNRYLDDLTQEMIAEFAKEHPEVVEAYKEEPKLISYFWQNVYGWKYEYRR